MKEYGTTTARVDRALPGSTVVLRLKGLVTEITSALPMATNLLCPNLTDRHWDTIGKTLNMENP